VPICPMSPQNENDCITTSAPSTRTGCVFAAAISPCAPARTRCDRQVLPAYGLQDLPIEGRNLPRQSNPNTMCQLITLGENLGGGHFYRAQTRTFLLCVDSADLPHFSIHAKRIGGEHEANGSGGAMRLTMKAAFCRLSARAF
jgi:hypothetical protein